MLPEVPRKLVGTRKKPDHDWKYIYALALNLYAFKKTNNPTRTHKNNLRT